MKMSTHCQKYAVVNFLKKNEVSVANKKWLDIEENVCAWPPFKNAAMITNAIVDGFPEPNDTWKRYEVTVMGMYESYEKAKRKADVALETSNLESFSDSDTIQKPEYIPTMGVDESSSDLEDFTQEPSNRKKQTNLPQPRDFRHKFPQYGKEGIESRVSGNISTKATESPLGPFQKRTLHMLTHMRRQMDELVILVTRLMQNPAHHTLPPISAASPSSLPEFPLCTLEDVGKFEDYVLESQNFQTAVKYLGHKGGIDVSQTVRRILNTLMTDELAAKYNWAGRAPKLPFKSLKMPLVVLYAVREKDSFKNTESKIVEDIIKVWLKNASTRSRSRLGAHPRDSDPGNE